MLDILIKNGKIYNGSERLPYKKNIGIKGDRIETITSDEPPASKVIDAIGLAISPGFIDMHSHTDFSIKDNPEAESKVMQGITTEVVGMCGFSPAPTNGNYFNDLMDYFNNTITLSKEEKLQWRWKNLYEFYEEIEKKGISVNLAPLLGYGTLRVAYSGFSKTPNTLLPEQQKKILYQIEKEMEAGIWGVSTALEYPPCSYCDVEEIAKACKIVKRFNGIYSTHMRNEHRKKVFTSLEEAIKVAQISGVNLEIAHLKVAFKEGWGKASEILNRIHQERKRGIEINADQYPYTAWGSSILDFLPKNIIYKGINYWRNYLLKKENRKEIIRFIKNNPEGPEKGMGWEGVIIANTKTKNNEIIVGKSMHELSIIRKIEPEELIIDLLIEKEGYVKLIVFCMKEEDVKTILKDSLVMIGSDGRAVSPYGKFSKIHYHPRYYGTFPRILGKYVREEKVLSLAEAIRKMTFMPASKIGIKDRGQITEGAFADIVIFNPHSIIDNATFVNPQRFPSGIKEVLVNGKIVVEKGELTSSSPGKFLRRK
ncbi:N-acyl-D-glutamate deacylase [subsurface metagenome]